MVVFDVNLNPFSSGQRHDRNVSGSRSFFVALQVEVQPRQDRHHDRSGRLPPRRPRQGIEQLHHEDQRMVIFFTSLFRSWLKGTACSDSSTVVTKMVFSLKLDKHRTDVTFLFDCDNDTLSQSLVDA